jgi:putative ABC transport system permease protein
MLHVRLAIRALRAAPVVSCVAILSLMLGIGANTAVFSIVNAVLLKPLPYPDPDRIVLLGYTFSGASVPFVSETKLNVWKEQHASWEASWEDVAGLRSRRVTLTDGLQAQQVLALQTNTACFTLFGARPARGRVFTVAEDRPGGNRVALLSDGFWKRRFGSDPSIVGRQLRLDGAMTTVVGILDAHVDTAIFNQAPDVWMPLQLDPNSADHLPSLIGAARLTPGTSIALAQSQARLAGEAFHRRFPEASGLNDTFTVAPLQDALVRHVRASLLVLVGAVTCVLLIACANVANLMLIRGSVRQRDIAIRTALGATRWQIVRQLVLESLTLAVVGGVLGLAFGHMGIRALLSMNPADLPRIGPDAVGVAMDWRVLAFTFAVVSTTGLVCGVWPTISLLSLLRLSGGNHALHIASGGRSGPTGPERRVRALLVVGEMALALVLLVGASLLIRTFVALNRVDRGYDARDVITLRVALTDPRFTKTSAVEELIRTTSERVAALPGVVGAAATRTLPLESDWRTSVHISDRPFETSPVIVSYRIVSPDYFDVLGIPIVSGRALSSGDGLGSPPVAIVNQAMARRLWSVGDPLNDRITLFPGRVPDDEPARQIVGIVGNVRDGMPLEQNDRPIVYVPLAQLLDRESAAQAPASLAWVVRTHAESSAIARSIQREIARASGDAPVADVRSLGQLASRAIASTTFSMTVLVVFSACAVVLAAVGMYAVISYAVQQRTYEIGVRLALGARWHQIRNMVLFDGLKLASCGVALGVVASAGLAGALATLLFEIAPHDLLTFATAPLLLCAVACAAVWIPARRASRIDPAEILRRL